MNIAPYRMMGEISSLISICKSIRDSDRIEFHQRERKAALRKKVLNACSIPAQRNALKAVKEYDLNITYESTLWENRNITVDGRTQLQDIREFIFDKKMKELGDAIQDFEKLWGRLPNHMYDDIEELRGERT